MAKEYLNDVVLFVPKNKHKIDKHCVQNNLDDCHEISRTLLVKNIEKFRLNTLR